MITNQIDWNALKVRLHEALASADHPLRLKDTPDFPLAFNVPMPDWFQFPNGNVSARFEQFAVTGFDTPELDSAASQQSDGRLRLALRWDEMQVTGRYSIGAKEAPVVTMDTAGNLLDFDEDIGTGGAESEDPIPEDTKGKMIGQAREERERLRDTPNGQKLIGQYQEHNEVYNEVFLSPVTGPQARRIWREDGATKEMSLDTQKALSADERDRTPVNPKKEARTYGEKNVSYNENAFRQQLMMVTNSLLADPNANLLEPPDPDSKYTKASLAAMTFSKAVDETGNSKTQVTEMTGEQVHQSVAVAKEPPPSSTDELANMMAQGMRDGGEEAEIASSNNWRILDEEDRLWVRQLIYAAQKNRAMSETAVLTQLWSGDCGAQFSGAEATIELVFEGGRWKIDSINVILPAFEFDLDDSHWSGEAAEVVRERLAEMSFVRSLLHERIRVGLADLLKEVAPPFF